MREIYKNGHKISRRLLYNPASCDLFTQVSVPCKERLNTAGQLVKDYTVGFEQCCGGLCAPVRECVKPDINLCNIGLGKDGTNPVVKIAWNGNPPNYTCTYNYDKIDTAQQILQVGTTNAQKIEFCAKQSDKCSTQGKCSRLLSIDEEGTFCRAFVSQFPESKNAIIDEYCLKNAFSRDCKCVNRTYYNDYNISKKNNPITDSCWYKPCNTENILKKEEAKNCPQNMCNIILDAHNDRNVAITNNSINCNFKSEEQTNLSNLSELTFPIIIGISFFLFLAIFTF